MKCKCQCHNPEHTQAAIEKKPASVIMTCEIVGIGLDQFSSNGWVDLLMPFESGGTRRERFRPGDLVQLKVTL